MKDRIAKQMQEEEHRREFVRKVTEKVLREKSYNAMTLSN